MTVARGSTRAEAERLIDARPAGIYIVLADYTTHHPRIMPASLFSNLEVETGGVGAGTVFHVTFRLFGLAQRLRMQVSEPDRGRVLTERNLDTGVVTVFSVTSEDGESPTLVRMFSEWQSGTGLRGLIDRLIVPSLMSYVFTRQLRELDRYMRSGEARSALERAVNRAPAKSIC
jgi:hypothetical protein